jgi:glycosyltransferase involved in cell wall biosynthesis
MKIAFASVLYGGLDTYVLESGRWLAEHGHTVHVIYFQKDPLPQRERYRKLHFHVITPSNLPYYVNRLDVLKTQIAGIVNLYLYSRQMAQKLREIQATDGLDLVELHESFSNPELFKGIPYVVKMHGAEWTLRHFCGDGAYPPALIGIERRLLMGARRIFPVSYAHWNFISGACNVPPDRFTMVRYPSDLSHFSAAEPPRQGPPFRLMTVGRLQKRKGIHTAVAALRKVWQSEPDTHLYLYGGQGDFGKPEIDALIPESEQQGRIHIEGFVSRETLIQRYQETHVYLAPTRYEVSGGFHIQEAIACGRPVVGAEIGPVPELVRNEATGWLVPRDDVDATAEKILFALRNPDIREKYGRAGRELALQFDADKVMERQVRLYEQAIRGLFT